MKTPKTLLTAGAITAFSFSLAFGAEQQQSETGATERDTQTRIEIEQEEETDAAQQQQQEFGARAETRQQEVEVTVKGDMKPHKASDLKGSRVQSQDGERLGTVDDLAVDLQSGEVAYLIVSSGGFLGIGGDLHPVPPEAVQIREADRGVELVLDISEQEWENAPTVEREEIAQLGEQTQGQEIYQFYGQEFQARQTRQVEFGAPERLEDETREEPALQQDDRETLEQDTEQQQSQEIQEFGSVQHRDEEQSVQAQAGQQSQTNQQHASGLGADQSLGIQQEQREYGAPQRDQEQKAEKHEEKAEAHEQRAQAHEEQAGAQESQQEFGAAQREDSSVRVSTQRDHQARQSGQGQIKLAEDLKDTDVTNSQQQTLGTIDDFIVNLEEGSIEFVLLTPDTGFWETADETYAIAPQAFQVSGEDQIMLNITQQDLEQAQTLNKQNIQQHSQQARMAGAQSRQQPQVFRYQEEEDSGSIFGAPDRERDQDKSERDEDKTLSPQERAQEQDQNVETY